MHLKRRITYSSPVYLKDRLQILFVITVTVRSKRRIGKTAGTSWYLWSQFKRKWVWIEFLYSHPLPAQLLTLRPTSWQMSLWFLDCLSVYEIFSLKTFCAGRNQTSHTWWTWKHGDVSWRSKVNNWCFIGEW